MRSIVTEFADSPADAKTLHEFTSVQGRLFTSLGHRNLQGDCKTGLDAAGKAGSRLRRL